MGDPGRDSEVRWAQSGAESDRERQRASARKPQRIKMEDHVEENDLFDSIFAPADEGKQGGEAPGSDDEGTVLDAAARDQSPRDKVIRESFALR